MVYEELYVPIMWNKFTKFITDNIFTPLHILNGTLLDIKG